VVYIQFHIQYGTTGIIYKSGIYAESCRASGGDPKMMGIPVIIKDSTIHVNHQCPLRNLKKAGNTRGSE